MGLENITLKQFAGLWSRLEQCYYNDDSYGGNTCEIYAYTLQERAPVLEHENLSDYGRERKFEIAIEAKMTLAQVCMMFESMRDVVIEIDGMRIHNWLARVGSLDHRAHVKVITGKD